MKALKIFLIVIVLLVAVVVVLGMMGPSHVHIERSVQIDAPADFVMSHANSFEEMNKWSPWAEKDPNMTQTIEGTDGAVGAIYSWEGNDQVGKGNQVINAVSENSISTDLNFIEPFEGHSKATFSVEENEGVTTATWAYDEEPVFMSKVIYTFMNLDEMLGPDFESGVNKLKAYVEGDKANRKTFNNFEVKTEELAPKTYVGIRQTVKWDAMTDFFGGSYGKIYPAVEKAKLEPMGAPSAIYYMWDEENQQADVMASAPLAPGSTLKDMTVQDVSGKALVIDYFGDYEGSAKAHEAMEQYMKWHNVEFGGLVVEEYITDPMNEPDPAKWHTRVIYTIK